MFRFPKQVLNQQILRLFLKKDKKTQRPVSIILMPQKSTKGVSSVKCLATSKKFFLNISAGSVKV